MFNELNSNTVREYLTHTTTNLSNTPRHILSIRYYVNAISCCPLFTTAPTGGCSLSRVTRQHVPRPPRMTSRQKADRERAGLTCLSSVRKEAESCHTRAHVTAEKERQLRCSIGTSSPRQAKIMDWAQATAAWGSDAISKPSVSPYTSGISSSARNQQMLPMQPTTMANPPPTATCVHLG